MNREKTIRKIEKMMEGEWERKQRAHTIVCYWDGAPAIAFIHVYE